MGIVRKFLGLWRKIFGSGSVAGEFDQKVSVLQERVRLLEELYERDRDGPESPPVIVERLFVEKLTLDKVELNNHIGSVGIKELSGVLNVGANYGWGFQPRENRPGKGTAPPPRSAETKKGPVRGQSEQSAKQEVKPRPDKLRASEFHFTSRPGMKKRPPQGAGPKCNIIFEETTKATGT
ncbi:MAG: hypothetical protein MJA84_13950 [Firmicutes bacterium]|nr:hypothetical protein [Bacillota bacterium]